MKADTTPSSPSKEARWMLYLCPAMFLVGVVFLPINVVDWIKSPHFLWASQIIGDCGFIWFGASGFLEAQYTLRTGIKRLSAGRLAASLLVIIGQLGRHISQHELLVLLWPWLLGGLVLFALYPIARFYFHKRQSRTEKGK